MRKKHEFIITIKGKDEASKLLENLRKKIKGVSLNVLDKIAIDARNGLRSTPFYVFDTVRIMRHYEQAGPWAEMLGTSEPKIFISENDLMSFKNHYSRSSKYLKAFYASFYPPRFGTRLLDPLKYPADPFGMYYETEKV